MSEFNKKPNLHIINRIEADSNRNNTVKNISLLPFKMVRCFILSVLVSLYIPAKGINSLLSIPLAIGAICLYLWEPYKHDFMIKVIYCFFGSVIIAPVIESIIKVIDPDFVIPSSGNGFHRNSGVSLNKKL